LFKKCLATFLQPGNNKTVKKLLTKEVRIAGLEECAGLVCHHHITAVCYLVFILGMDVDCHTLGCHSDGRTRVQLGQSVVNLPEWVYCSYWFLLLWLLQPGQL